MASPLHNPALVNPSASPDKLIIRAFARLDQFALGVAVGANLGLAILLATIFLILKGGSPIGPNLQLLNQFFVGYSVTLKGSLVGFAYGFVCGFMMGWLVAFLRNTLLNIYLHTVKLKADMASYMDFID